MIDIDGAPPIRTDAQREAHNDSILREALRAAMLATPKKKLTQAQNAQGWSQTPSGRREQRGFPIAARGGLDIRRDPVVELMARERSALKGAARKAYDAIEDARIVR